MHNNELYHFGIKGMKWGVRRFQNKDGSLTSKGKKRYSDDYKESQNISKKSVSEMSNAELRKINERKRLEQEYSRLNPSTLKKGLTVVGTVSGVLGTAAALYNNSNALVKIGKKFLNK